MKTNKPVMRKSARFILGGAITILTLAIGACQNSQGGFAGSVGNTPNGPPQTIFKILGTDGEPFTATISNARSSWQLQGTVPLSVTIVNNLLPASAIATKLAGDANLLSLEILNGSHVIELASTNAAFGNVSVQSGKKHVGIAPAASPDLRIFVIGPAGEHFTGLVEDIATAFVVDDRAPALFLFDSPNGKVRGTFTQVQNFGDFSINMTLDGAVVATVTGGPTVIINEP